MATQRPKNRSAKNGDNRYRAGCCRTAKQQAADRKRRKRWHELIAAVTSLPWIDGSATDKTWRKHENQNHRKPIKKVAQGPSTCPHDALYYKKSEERGCTLADKKDRHPPCNEINIGHLSNWWEDLHGAWSCDRLVMQPQFFGCANLQLAQEEKKRRKKTIPSVCYTSDTHTHIIPYTLIYVCVRVCITHARMICYDDVLWVSGRVWCMMYASRSVWCMMYESSWRSRNVYVLCVWISKRFVFYVYMLCAWISSDNIVEIIFSRSIDDYAIINNDAYVFGDYKQTGDNIPPF